MMFLARYPIPLMSWGRATHTHFNFKKTINWQGYWQEHLQLPQQQENFNAKCCSTHWRMLLINHKETLSYNQPKHIQYCCKIDVTKACPRSISDQYLGHNYWLSSILLLLFLNVYQQSLKLPFFQLRRLNKQYKVWALLVMTLSNIN